MRQSRLKVPAERPVGFYHCISRIIQRQFFFGDVERERFVALLREYEAFCGVRVLTYCVLSNHFHVLVEVPKRPEVLPSAEELLARLKKLSCHQDLGAFEQRLALYRNPPTGSPEVGTPNAGPDAAGEQAFLESYFRRMWDVSWFLRLVKQRFSTWYNQRNDRKGTLWEERFKSVLVDGAGEALVTMAAYIDLNPVRAGLAKDPKDYRWSGYAEAVAGSKRARAGIQTIVTAMRRGKEEPAAKSLETYRMQVFACGDEQRENLTEDGRLQRGAIKRETVAEVLRRKGTLSLPEYLRCRVRYFCDGAIFGGKEFVEEMFGAHRGRFGPKRQSGARRMKGVDADLFTVRDLQVGVFG